MDVHACTCTSVVCAWICACVCCVYVRTYNRILPPQLPTLFTLPPAAGKVNRCVISIFLLCMLTFHSIIQPSPAKLIN